MFDLARMFLDNKISRRSFIAGLTQAGVSVTGAAAVAESLGADNHAGAVTADSTRQKGRLLENHTGGELMAEFLIDWKVPYVFGLAGSEEVGTAH